MTFHGRCPSCSLPARGDVAAGALTHWCASGCSTDEVIAVARILARRHLLDPEPPSPTTDYVAGVLLAVGSTSDETHTDHPYIESHLT